jgi:hypothetical protein
MAAVSELCDRLGVIEALDTAIGPVRQRDRGSGPGSYWPGSRWRSWLGRTSGPGWTASALMRPGS